MILGAMTIRIWREFQRQPRLLPDDQVQHVIPFKHFLPGSPLPIDHIVDFYLSENSVLFTWLYAAPAMVGVEPRAWAAVVAAASASATLLAVHALMRAAGGSRAMAAAAVVLMLTALGARDDIVVGSARTLGWPLLAAALWALIASRPRWFAAFTALAALVYPSVAVIAIATAGLYVLATAIFGRNVAVVRRWLVPLAVPMGLLLTWKLGSDRWGPTISPDLARTLPEFAPDGRSAYFYPDIWRLYFVSDRSGLLDPRFFLMWHLVPLAIGAVFVRNDPRFVRLACALIVASSGLWALAHLLLYTLYLPSRYSSYGLVLAAVLLAASTLGAIADRHRFGTVIVLAVLLASPVQMMARTRYPFFSLYGPSTPGLYDRIIAAPGRGRVAGIARDLDFVTTFTGRPVLWSRESAMPYKLRYRDEVVRQLNAAGVAILSPGPGPLIGWTRANAIDWLLVDDDVIRRGAQADLIATTPGGVELARRFPKRPDTWLARQTKCAVHEAETTLYSVPCLAAEAQGGAVSGRLPGGLGRRLDTRVPVP